MSNTSTPYLCCLGPADVHPHQHLGPVGGVDATGAGPDGDQRLALVVLAADSSVRTSIAAMSSRSFLQLRVGLGVRVVAARASFFCGHLVEHRQVVEPLAQLLDAAQFALGVRQLAGDLLGAGLVVPQLGIGGLVLEFLDAAAKPVDVEHPLHRGQRGVERGDVGLTVGIHGSSGTDRIDRPAAFIDRV